MVRFAATLMAGLWASLGFAQVKSIGEVSFAVPEGWKYESAENHDFATVMLTQGDRFWVVAVYNTISSSGDADRDFASVWTKIVANSPVPEPIYSYTGSAGYSGRNGMTTVSEGRFVRLYLLESEHDAIPVLAIAQSRHSFDDMEPMILQVVESVRVAPMKAQPLKNNVTISDLVGQWTTGGESSVNYANSVTGTYAGSSTVAHGVAYSIAADGTYSYRFAGVSNRNTLRGQGTGTVEVSSRLIAFRDKDTNQITRYRLISYQAALNGATLLTLLPDSYDATGPNISFYAERWIRDAPKK
jgi:hypothetical protein